MRNIKTIFGIDYIVIKNPSGLDVLFGNMGHLNDE